MLVWLNWFAVDVGHVFCPSGYCILVDYCSLDLPFQFLMRLQLIAVVQTCRFRSWWVHTCSFSFRMNKVWVFAPVQCNWACFTWKGSLEIRSLLLLWLLNRLCPFESRSSVLPPPLSAPSGLKSIFYHTILHSLAFFWHYYGYAVSRSLSHKVRKFPIQPASRNHFPTQTVSQFPNTTCRLLYHSKPPFQRYIAEWKLAR